jgi:uncharacterized membrane protein YfcA
MQQLIITIIIFLSSFTQGLAGFGVALVAMALLPGLVDIHQAAPLVAVVGLTVDILLLIYYRDSVNVNAIWRVLLASIVGIPLGIWALSGVDEQVFTAVLGVILAGYAIYGLLNFKLPELIHPLWAYLAGFLGGVLGGAFNTSGPPVVIYANCRRWPPREFKSNLQGFFIINSLLVVLGHGLGGNLNPAVWRGYLWSLPAILLGVLAGVSLDRVINPQVFRKIVLVLLVIMGVRLILA